MTNEECLHETLYFGSGDFYMICRKCQRYWRMEDHYSNNVGEACKLSGQDRVTARPEERAQDPGTEKILRTLLDRAYKMMLMSVGPVAEHNPDHNDPFIAWMSDTRHVLYGNGRQPDPVRDLQGKQPT